MESLREIRSRQYDSRTDKLLSSYDVVIIRKEYFYKKAEYRVLKYFKDGKERPPGDYNFPDQGPGLSSL